MSQRGRAEGAPRWRHAGVDPDIAARLARSCNRSTFERRAAHPSCLLPIGLQEGVHVIIEKSIVMLDEFRLNLERQLPSAYSRPFVCEGSPLKCRIFIVGTNSARLVEKPFFSFWDPSYGFKKKEFIRELELKPGGLTPTRKNIEIIVSAAGQEITLDTNFYLCPTPRAKHLNKEDNNADVFEYLLREIEPEIVLAHGNQAIKFFKKRCSGFIEDRVPLLPRTVTLDHLEFQLLCSRHLSY
jgi:hypothetical protein